MNIFSPESIDSLLEKAESGNRLVGSERKTLRIYLMNTMSGAGNRALRPVVQERISRIRDTQDLKMPGQEGQANDVISAFNRVVKVAPISSDVMRYSCFLYPENIHFFMLEDAAEHVPGLAVLLESSDNATETILSVLKPLEEAGLVKIDRKNEKYSTTEQIQEAIKSKDYS